MRSKSFIIGRLSLALVSIGIVLSAFQWAAGQRLAVLSPGPGDSNFTAALGEKLAANFKVLDTSLASSAFRSASPETPFNMTVEMSRNIGQRIGCDLFILVRTANQRRTSLSRGDYFEASAAVFMISARTGSLLFWHLQKFENAERQIAGSSLDSSAADLAKEIASAIPGILKSDLTAVSPPAMEEMPAENSPEANAFRPPVPYRRIKPLYTADADLFAVTATVDLELDLDEKGGILRTRIIRWAGYGLDEAVTEAVRKMNWRPAERNGKPLPLRVLLRYNFKKIEKDE